ncbi:hypothetical protein FQN54_008100 [Arachnomyces sp. PD_36]|nr:hypothetical protein FQN54_008100 [Arachnomyces sp. PD_36]
MDEHRQLTLERHEPCDDSQLLKSEDVVHTALPKGVLTGKKRKNGDEIYRNDSKQPTAEASLDYVRVHTDRVPGRDTQNELRAMCRSREAISEAIVPALPAEGAVVSKEVELWVDGVLRNVGLREQGQRSKSLVFILQSESKRSEAVRAWSRSLGRHVYFDGRLMREHKEALQVAHRAQYAVFDSVHLKQFSNMWMRVLGGRPDYFNMDLPFVRAFQVRWASLPVIVFLSAEQYRKLGLQRSFCRNRWSVDTMEEFI